MTSDFFFSCTLEKLGRTLEPCNLYLLKRMHIPVNFKVSAIQREKCVRERALLPWCAFNNARRGFTIYFTFYKVLIIMLVINVYGRFVLNFHLHYQVIPKIACVFSKPYEVQTRFQKSWDTVQIVNKNRMQ